MIDSLKEKTLISLFNDEITFAKAASILKVTDKELEKMIDNFNWVPSFETINKISEQEKNSISHIHEVIKKHSNPDQSPKIKHQFAFKFDPIGISSKIPRNFITSYTIGSPTPELVNPQTITITSTGLLSSFQPQSKMMGSIKAHQTEGGMQLQFQEVIRQCS